jgi:hypothetical protein
MSVSQAPALSAIAFQLAAALDAYEQDVELLVHGPLDLEMYQRVSRQMDQMRQYAAALPTVSVAWVEVLIRHFELTQGLWSIQAGKDAADLPRLQSRLQDAVRRLSNHCTQLMPKA